MKAVSWFLWTPLRKFVTGGTGKGLEAVGSEVDVAEKLATDKLA